MADFTYQKTALDIVKGAMSACDLREPSQGASSTDPKVKRFWRLLSEVGRDMAQGFDWQILRKEWTLTTVPGQYKYDTPDDFDGFSDSTGWNKASKIPLIGPMVQQSWQAVTAHALGSSLRMMYKYEGDQVVFQNVSGAAQSLSFYYQTSSWVQDAGDPSILRDHVENDGDIVLIYGRLMESALVLRWKLDRGLDTAGAKNTFDAIVESVTGRQSPGKIYYLGAMQGDGMLSIANAPESGYGL